MNRDKRECRRMEVLIVFGEWNSEFGGSVVFFLSSMHLSFWGQCSDMGRGMLGGERTTFPSSLIHGVPGLTPPSNS